MRAPWFPNTIPSWRRSPIRRCNLACTYCNEFDTVSAPVAWTRCCGAWTCWPRWAPRSSPSAAASRCCIPNLEEIVRRIRSRGAIATLITNGYLLTAERIHHLNRAGLDHLQITIDNVKPDEVSKKA